MCMSEVRSYLSAQTPTDRPRVRLDIPAAATRRLISQGVASRLMAATSGRANVVI